MNTSVFIQLNRWSTNCCLNWRMWVLSGQIGLKIKNQHIFEVELWILVCPTLCFGVRPVLIQLPKVWSLSSLIWACKLSSLLRMFFSVICARVYSCISRVYQRSSDLSWLKRKRKKRRKKGGPNFINFSEVKMHFMSSGFIWNSAGRTLEPTTGQVVFEITITY